MCVFWRRVVDFDLERVFKSFWTQGYFGHFVSKGKIVFWVRELFSSILSERD